PRLTREELLGDGTGESSQSVRARVCAARARQAERYGQPGKTNAELGPQEIEHHCRLSLEGKRLLARAIDHFALTGRGYVRVLKVARTIADLEGAEEIAPQHLAEALQYRAQELEGSGP
ncbi:MAG TPA: magnesium chelatase, partial [Candidatus Acetothermia bacterium]|nr:magnesium chelatase [Candidatus Acetothermia bacterium]